MAMGIKQLQCPCPPLVAVVVTGMGLRGRTGTGGQICLSQNLLLLHTKPSTASLHIPFPQSPSCPGMKPGWLKCHLWLHRHRLGEGNQAPHTKMLLTKS